jgi:hypothetical protein
MFLNRFEDVVCSDPIHRVQAPHKCGYYKPVSRRRVVIPLFRSRRQLPRGLNALTPVDLNTEAVDRWFPTDSSDFLFQEPVFEDHMLQERSAQQRGP